MKLIFLNKIRQVVQVFGFVLISVFYSAQSVANSFTFDIWNVPEINLHKNQDEEILYPLSAIIDSNLGWNPQFRLSFSDTSLTPNQYPGEQLIIKTLTNNEYTDGSLVTSPSIQSPQSRNNFDLGQWSKTISEVFPYLVTFQIKFSRDALWEWSRNSGKTTLDFFVVIHARSGWYHYTASSLVQIPIKREEYAHISGLEDIPLPQADTMKFCVSSTTEKVRLEFDATNSTSTFQLQASNNPNNAYTIGYNITLGGTRGDNHKEITIKKPGVQEGHKWDAHKANLSDIECNGTENMWILIDFNDQNEVDKAPAGEYKDTIKMTVSPV